MILLTCDHAPSALSFGAVQRIEEVREAADRDGTKSGVEICFACEANCSDGCCRENPLHALLRLAGRATELPRSRPTS